MKFSLIRASVVCAAVVFVGANVQSIPASEHAGQDKMSQDKMGRTETSDRSYTGCVERGDSPQKYVLTHVAATEEHMAHDAMAKDSMNKSAMSPTTWPITSAAVDLSKFVGQKVAVTGTAPGKGSAMGKDSMSKDTMAKDSMAKDSTGADARTFTVKTAKVVASSCQ